MCWHCHDEYCCVHGRYRRYPPYYYERPPIYYYEERPLPKTRRAYLEEEKKALERRLKELEDSLSEEKKSE